MLGSFYNKPTLLRLTPGLMELTGDVYNWKLISIRPYILILVSQFPSGNKHLDLSTIHFLLKCVQRQYALFTCILKCGLSDVKSLKFFLIRQIFLVLARHCLTLLRGYLIPFICEFYDLE